MGQVLEKKTSSVGLNAIADEDIITISRKFDFDYPVLSTQNIQALTSALEMEGSSFPLRLNAKFADNLNYLAQSKITSEDKVFSKAMSSFTTNLFLSLPERLMRMDQASLSDIFVKRDFEMEMSENTIFSNTREPTTSLLTWDEIFSGFFSFVLKGSTSLVCGVVPDDAPWCASNIIAGKHMEKLCETISRFGKLLSLAFASTESSLKASKETTMCEELTARVSRCGSDDRVLITSLQKVWLHMAFLARDILVQCPSLVESSLGTVLTSLDSLSTNIDGFHSHSGTSSADSYPSSKECLQALMCANIAASLSGRAVNSAKITAITTIKAQDAFRYVMSGGGQETSNVTLLILVDTLERMGRQASDGGAEACALLLDVCSLYVDNRDTRGTGFKGAAEVERMHQSLLSSRALAVLVDLFARFMGAEGASNVGKTPIIAQLVCFFSRAALQGPHIVGSFLLRLPLFLPSIRAMTQIWNEDSDNAAISPTEAIPLFLALCLALGADRPVEPSHEFVQALKGSVSLTVLRLRVAGEVEVSEHPEMSVSALEDEVEKQEVELKHDAQMKAMHVPGLASALRLLLSNDSAGRAAASRVKDFPDLHRALVELSEAIEGFSSRRDEVRRLGKGLKAALEGESGSKTD